MAKFELTDLKSTEGRAITIGDQITGEIIEFDPEGKSKHLFVLDMGNLPPALIRDQMNKWGEVLKEFLGEERVLLAARTSDHNPMSIYELKPVEEHTDDHT